MKRICSILMVVVLALQIPAQTLIKGKVIKAKSNKPVPFANILIKGSYDGTTTDEEGKFSFKTSETGTKTLVASSVGYEKAIKEVQIEGKELNLTIEMKSTVNELDYVVITAGAFEASDKKKAVILKPLDIVTTAGSGADVYGALKKLPGSQMVGEEEGLFIRGGAGYETKTIIDGMTVQNPYYSPVPDVPSRGRFNPFLFEGTVFSTGGYSALYGQALSSVLLLETKGMPQKTQTGIGLNFVQGTLSHTQKMKNSAISVAGAYTDLNPYYDIFEQNTDWVNSPIDYSGEMNYRWKPSKTGLLKLYSSYNTSNMSIRYPSLENLTGKVLFEQANENFYMNSTYKDALSKNWTIATGFSHSNDIDETAIDTFDITSDERLTQGRITFTRFLNDKNNIKFGTELGDLYIDGRYGWYKGKIDEFYNAAYTELNWFITPKLALRPGLRYENSEVIQEQNLAPRFSIAYKTGKHSQVSAAYGHFYQRPGNEFLFQSKELGFEYASHYILNYQWMIQDKRTFRVELYYKDYDDLVNGNYDSTARYYTTLQNKGYGYAKGVDVFWRDQQSIKFADYWISYSYLDTERKFRNYPISAAPDFTSEHNLSVLTKYWINPILTNVSLSYSFASGRPYFNPNKPAEEFHQDMGPDYHNFSLSLSKLTGLFGQFTVIYASVENIFNRNHIFGYRYSMDGERRMAIKPASPRSYFLGIIVSVEYD